MKALLISIQPQWVELILNLIKKDEIRKGTALFKVISKLIEKQGVAPTFIYCTKDKKYTLERNTDEPYDFFTLKDKKHLVFKLDKNHCGYNGKVVARFNATAEEITKQDYYPREDLASATMWYEWQTKSMLEDEILKRSCLKRSELNLYLNYKNGTVIHINDLEIFDKPKEISEFKRCQLLWCCVPHDCEKCRHALPLTRAPQSWCYIEV